MSSATRYRWDIPVMPPGVRTKRLPTTLIHDPARYVTALLFRDSSGAHWFRGLDGLLQSVDDSYNAEDSMGSRFTPL